MLFVVGSREVHCKVSNVSFPDEYESDMEIVDLMF